MYQLSTCFFSLLKGEHRFTGAVVRAGGSPNYTENQPCGLPATRAQSYIGAVNEFLCDPPRMARYVTLDIDSSSPDVSYAILQIAEVTVEEFTPGECPANDGETMLMNRPLFLLVTMSLALIISADLPAS